MQNEICIHIGLHKTGTTTLQEWVFPNLKRHKLVLRDRLIDFTPHVIHFPEYCLTAQKIDQFRDKFFSGNSVRLISEENLSGSPTLGYINRQNAIKNLGKIFPEAKIIVSITKQKELIISLYRHYLRQGGLKSFDEILKYNKRGKGLHFIIPETYLYSKLWDQLTLHFDRSNILFLPLELLAKEQCIYFENIEKFLNDKIKRTPNISQKSNTGISSGSEYIFKTVNKIRRSKITPGLFPKADKVFFELAKIAPKIHSENYNLLDNYSKLFISDNVELQNKTGIYLPDSYFID
jgi:hypothetical protein